MEYGLRQGLAQDLHYGQQIDNLHYNEQMNQQARLVAEKKAAMFADDFDYNNAMNQYDNPLVKQFAQGKIKEIGTFVNQNPDWQTNIAKRAQYKQMIRELKDNPDLNRGMQSDANFQAYQKDLAEKSKHPELFDADAYKAINGQWQNYIKYGNQNGEEAARTQGKTAFIYTQPQDWADLNKDGMEYGGKFNDFQIKPLKGGFAGSYQEVPKEESLNVLATDFYQRNKRQMDIRAGQAGFSNPLDYAKSLIRPGIKTKFDMGDAGASLGFEKYRDEKGEKVPTVGNYTLDVAKSDKGVVNGQLFEKMFGVKPPLRISSDDKTQEINLTGQPVEYTGYNAYLNDADKKAGIKHAQVIVKLSKKEAQKQGILSDNWVQDDSIDPSWKGKAKLETSQNKDGKDVEYVSVTEMLPFNVNTSSYQGIYDTQSSASKFAEAPKDTYQQSNPKSVVQNGITYVLNEATGKYE